jgi:hypothetical protein
MSKVFVLEFSVDEPRSADGPIFPAPKRFRVFVETERVRAYLETPDDFGGLQWSQLVLVDGDPLSASGIIALAIRGYINAEHRIFERLPNGLEVIKLGTIKREA